MHYNASIGYVIIPKTNVSSRELEGINSRLRFNLLLFAVWLNLSPLWPHLSPFRMSSFRRVAADQPWLQLSPFSFSPFRWVAGDQPWPQLPPSLVHSTEHAATQFSPGEPSGFMCLTFFEMNCPVRVQDFFFFRCPRIFAQYVLLTMDSRRDVRSGTRQQQKTSSWEITTEVVGAFWFRHGHFTIRQTFDQYWTAGFIYFLISLNRWIPSQLNSRNSLTIYILRY